MSQHKIALALGFLDAQPRAAAEIIELQNTQDAAEFIASIPAEKAALVMSAMLPQYAAQLCQQIPHDVTLSILIRMDAKILVHIFRRFPTAQRDHFLKELPTQTHVACTLILNYSETMVGAWVTSQILTIPDRSNVAEALQRVETSALPIVGNSIYIVDRDQQLKGQIPLIDLMRAPKEMPVNGVFKGELFSINGKMLATEAAASPIWQNEDTVPVLNRRHELVGALRHADLRRAINTLRQSSHQWKETPDLLTGISQGYGQTLLALVQSMQEFAQSEIHPKSHH